MLVLHSFADLTTLSRPVHLALGVFDGVHLGHRAVIENAIKQAKKNGGLSGVLTFDRNPLETLVPERAPKRLLAHTGHKEKLIEDLGADVLIVLPFTQELASLSASEFLSELTTKLQLASISIGEDWRFGKGREGGIDFLRDRGAKDGFEVYTIKPVLDESGERISSTAVREAVSQGEFARARKMLGHDYTVIGKVVPGRQIARELGYPTANLDIYNEQLPPEGVYVAEAMLPGGERHYSLVNLGRRPSVAAGADDLLLEVHLMDWRGDLYGQEIEVRFLKFIRKEFRFSRLEELKARIRQDEDEARVILVSMKSGGGES